MLKGCTCADEETAAWCAAVAKRMSDRPDEWLDIDSMFSKEDEGDSMLGVDTLLQMAQEQCLGGRVSTHRQ